ncbi:bifunctional methylenetetrahydrofolate dehydrogenase/methenyltetrahydrofolate cyclohydrolase FolD [Candidatus Saganbacteria bacterium]|nr:bifunctional methylenetetrahydrofolate dehydrogenase/methenyltetrahydrofolate cyclohydrolase FolD [Candidatus Saganbacteria bacterium]
MVRIIDGKSVADGIKDDLRGRVRQLKESGVVPNLSVILVGGDPASQVYVRNKEKGCESIGMLSNIVCLPESASVDQIIAEINRINSDMSVHGLLVQLPLPKGLNERAILDVISPEKDVDGLHISNMGRLLKGEAALFMPCTPQGIMELIMSTGISISGKHAVVVGRSNIVGKPISLMLLAANATVTICHSKTEAIDNVIRSGDIVVVAVGRPKLIKGNSIKDGAVVIDVGINRQGGKLVGDVDFDSAKDKASYITPVPGGVGPMTIAMLLKNTIISAERSLKNRSA